MTIDMYKNALNNWEATITNLNSQLSLNDITEERKKDIETQLKNAKKQVKDITEKIKEMEASK